MVKQPKEDMIQKTKRSIQWVKQSKYRNIEISRYIGIHLIAEFWHGRIIENPKEIEKLLLGAAKQANNTPLDIAVHKFQPQGITGIVLLAESHIAIHSWPEFNYTAIDIYTCGDKSSPAKALEYLKKELQPKKVEIKKIKRGKMIY